MCDACEFEFTSPAAVSAELIIRMRTIEVAMAGAPVAEEDWNVFLGRAGGSIGWTQYERMLLSRHKAAQDLSSEQSLARASPRRCDAI